MRDILVYNYFPVSKIASIITRVDVHGQGMDLHLGGPESEKLGDQNNT
jgi:hypothetical protein